MTDSAAEQSPHIETTADIVAAYVSRNSVPVADLPALIRSVHDALSNLGAPPAVEAPAPKREPAVSIRKSVTDDYIISLEDGRKLKSMKRYLAGLGMTPADYCAIWGLPADYPMVAPAYAAKRSELARAVGLGRKATAAADVAPEPAPAPQPEPEAAAPAPKRGRAKKAA